MSEKPAQTGLRASTQDHDRLQAVLDRVFPHGALCAVIPTDLGRIDEAKSCVTGRLVCDRSERSKDRVWYRMTIDPRRTVDENTDVIQLWTGEPQRRPEGKDLWEADVRTEDGATSILRLNASPPEQWRPSAAMRQAVTERYAEDVATSVASS